MHLNEIISINPYQYVLFEGKKQKEILKTIYLGNNI